MDGDDEDAIMLPLSFSLPNSVPTGVPLERAMAFMYMIEMGDLSGFAVVGDEEFQADHANMPSQ